jgi:hypothetical protein
VHTPLALWSIVLVIGMARLWSALSGWPKIAPAEAGARALLADRLTSRLQRSALAGLLIALSTAGLFHQSFILTRLPLWAAVAAMTWSAMSLWKFEREGSRPEAVARLSRCSSFAARATLAAGIVASIRAITISASGLALLFAGTLCALAAMHYALVEQAASDVDSLRVE